MNEDDIPNNTMIISMTLLDDGQMKVAVGHNLDDEDIEEESYFYMLDILNGMRIHLDTAMENLAATGRMARTIVELSEQEIDFEPDEELLRAIEENREGNVVPFDKKKLN